MKYFIIIFLSLYVSMSGYSQAAKDIEIIEEQGSNTLTLYGINNTLQPADVTFRFEVQGFTSDMNSPVETQIAPKMKVKLVTLTAPVNTECSYTSSVSYNKRKAGMDQPPQREATTTSTQMNMNKINVFTKNGCGRCEFTIKYLQENNIPYVELNTSMHQPNNDLMWEQLEKTDHNSKSVQLPVIVQNGRVYQNIESLPALLKSFK